MRTRSVSKLLFLAVWLLFSPGLLFAQQDSLPGSSLPPQGGFPVPPAQGSDTLITVKKLPYPTARILDHRVRVGLTPAPHERSEHPRAAAKSVLANQESRIANLDSCIHHRHARLLAADLTTLHESKKGTWLKYLPTVRAGLAPALRIREGLAPAQGLAPSLSIGLNSSLIYQAHRDKQQRAATREAIIKRSQLKEDLEIAQLHRLHRRLQIETDKLNLQTGVADIDRQLFNLYQKQYDNHDITPEEYLLKRKAFFQQELRNQDQIARIEAIQYEIEELAGCLSVPPISENSPSRK